MSPPIRFAPSRRAVLAASLGLALPAPAVLAQDGKPAPRTLVAAPARVRLRPAPSPETEIWALDGTAPGPVLRVKAGETLPLAIANRTGAPFALHWHGLRGEAAQDGVGGFSQAPIAPGATGNVTLAPREPGTILYRPMMVGGSSEPAGRGLSGLLVVEEREPPAVDLDHPVLVSDWLLGEDGAIAPFEKPPREGASAGRLGSWLTANGKAPPERVAVAPGARVRLRLANGCNARITRLRFEGAKVFVVAVDGQPTDTFEPVKAQLPFPPGTRYDLIFDMPAEAGASFTASALIGAGVPLVRFVAEGKPITAKRGEIAALPPNPTLPAAVRLQDARRSSVVIEGGAKQVDGRLDASGLDPARPWSVNGAVGAADGKPLFSVKRGTPVVIALDNRTAFAQPLHVHGHCFRLLHPLDDGWEPYFLDTVQVPENRRLHIAFIAENPGRWPISSSILERFDLGLWTWFEVT